MMEFTQRLRVTVESELPLSVEFYQESLDLDRFRGGDRLSDLQAYFEQKYRGFGIDVLVPVGSRALKFAVEQLGDVFPGTPVVFALTAPPATDPAMLPRNVTGRVGITSRFAPTIEMARRLQPDARQLVIVGGATAQDSSGVAAVLGAIAARHDALPVSVMRGLALDTLLVKLRGLSPQSIVIFANYRGGGRGAVFDPIDIVGSLARASAAPMYTQLRSYIGEGPVGGAATSFDDEGAQTGLLLVRVLRRRAGAPLPPVERIGNSFVVDWRQLRRWGLSEARLPPETEVLFREPTPWQRYRMALLLTLSVVAAESLLIGRLLLERRRRQRVQLALDEQMAYEQMMAHLKVDAVHHSLDGGFHALHDALARIATYAHASAALLVQYGEGRFETPTRIVWPPRDPGNEDAALRLASVVVTEHARLEIPLRADGTSLGALTLVNDGGRWPVELVRRIETAGEIVADALARVRAARALDDVKRQVMHMARVALVGELAATLSHELRQPLAAIRANAEAGALLLARSRDNQHEVREIFSHIVADDTRAVEVIESVRRLLRKEVQGATVVDLNEVCRQAVGLLEQDARLRHTRLELALAPSLPPVRGDPIQLQQAVLNLALNALDAASMSETERFVVVATEACLGHIEVSIRDSGAGMPDDVHAHLFESFFSTKAGGLGLGLVIVRSIVERHHGRVCAENHASGGAVFRVRLPVESSREGDARGFAGNWVTREGTGFEPTVRY